MSSEEFDPYRKWLGIPPSEQPPNYYRLLGIALFEEDPDVIQNAADRQMAHVRTFKMSRYAGESQKLLNELSAAKVCLLTPDDKFEYDAHLHVELAPPEAVPVRAPEPQTPPPPPLGVVPPAMAEPPPPAAPPTVVPSIGRLGINIGPRIAPPVLEPTPVAVGAPVGVPVAVAATPVALAVTPVATAAPAPVATAPVAIAPAGVAAGTAVLPGRPVPVPLAPVAEPSASPDVNPVVRSGSPVARGRGPGGDKESSSLWMVILGIGAGVVVIIGLVIALNQSAHSGNPATTKRPEVKPPRPGGKTTDPRVEPPGKRPDPNEFKAQPPLELPMTSSNDAQLDKELTEVRHLLERRDIDAARKRLGEAGKHAKDAASKARVEQLEVLSTYLSNFWEGVRKGVFYSRLMDMMGKPLQVKFSEGEREYELVKRDEDRVTYRVGGREQTHRMHDLPRQDAIAFARHGWGLRREGSPSLSATDQAWNDLYVATFLIFEPGDNPQARREQAKRLWRNAADAGVANPFVAKELGLEKEVPAGVSLPSRPPETPNVEPRPRPMPPMPMPQPRPQPMPPVRPPRPMPMVGDDMRRPVPAGAELKTAQDKLRGKFTDLYDKARTDGNGKAALAAALVEEAVKPDSGPVHKYAALAKAWELAAEAGRVEPALSIIDVAGEEFGIDVVAEKIVALDKVFVPATSGETAAEAAAAAKALYDEALSRKRFDQAGEAARIAGRGAKAAGDVAGERKAREQADSVRELATDQKAADKAAKTLETNADEPVANFLVGRFKCLGLEDWDAGLPLLAKGSDKELKDLAATETAAPTMPDAQLKLGAGWLVFGKRKGGLAGKHVVKHAALWLERAEAGLEGDKREEAAARLKEAREALKGSD